MGTRFLLDPDWKNYIPTRLELFESLYRYGLKGSDEAILRVSWKNVFIDSLKKTESQISNARTGGGVLPIVAYMGRLRPKGVPFSGFRYIKG